MDDTHGFGWQRVLARAIAHQIYVMTYVLYLNCTRLKMAQRMTQPRRSAN